MALDKQISQVSFHSNSFSNGNATNGERYNFNVTDFDLDIDPEFYNGTPYDKAISGKLRQNLRGVRPKVSLTYNTSTESTLFFSFVNDLIAAFAVNNDDSIEFQPDASKLDSFDVVLDSGTGLLTKYRSTVGSFKPTVQLIALNHLVTIPDYLIAP